MKPSEPAEWGREFWGEDGCIMIGTDRTSLCWIILKENSSED
ncbi:hypothetical protein SLEP1_g30007 [Rubroshorea leprosula]|uniref:Uncharacterized protein n=1 Tax=Rubroshorea leprosula TaxID=152421 RepID=A0AAV5K7K4_9ROSI|nr:hypothetical protein SLEP1_g30007 [Rubroshorea leprosula]